MSIFNREKSGTNTMIHEKHGELTRGQCKNCGFKGYGKEATLITPDDVNGITGHVSEYAPTVFQCLTCLDTPTGMRSDNVTHRRLPAEEYKL